MESLMAESMEKADDNGGSPEEIGLKRGNRGSSGSRDGRRGSMATVWSLVKCAGRGMHYHGE